VVSSRVPTQKGRDAMDPEHESMASEKAAGRAEEGGDDAEVHTGRETETDGEGDESAESSFAGLGELEDVPGFDPRHVLREQLGELGTAETAGEEITPYEELVKLPPIESLLFEQQETVCGADNRVQITSTTAVPWRWNCKLVIHLSDGRKGGGTGFFIGPCTVMTAGHCVHTGKNGKWMSKIEVIPGMNGATRPYGTYVTSNFRSVKGWTESGKVTHDYGAVILGHSQKVGCTIGYFGFAAYSDGTLKNMLVNTAGYPGDKTFGTQWFMSDRITKVESRRIHYLIDTFGGQSGSAVWRLTEGKRYAVGVHAYGGCPNKATRIVKAVFDNMKTWKGLCSC
jgi:glutamyl endopeptidase